MSSLSQIDLCKTYTFLTKSFFETILRKSENDTKVTVKDFQLTGSRAEGEINNSQLIRAKVNYLSGTKESGVHQFIIKAALVNQEHNEYLRENNVFEKEVTVFRDIIPKAQQLLETSDDNTKFSARYHCGDEKLSYLVFDDLTAAGHTNLEKGVGLSVDQLKSVLTKLAKWHAATAVLGTKDNFIALNNLQPNIRKDAAALFPLLTNVLESCAEVAATWAGYESIAVKLRKLADVIPQRCCREFIRNEQALLVLVHGDLWANNILFGVADAPGVIPSSMFVDFADSHWGSPGADLCYLLFTSSNGDVREFHWDKLIQHYHDELHATLTKLKYAKEVPTLTDIHVQILRTGSYALTIGILMAGLRQLEKSPVDVYASLVGNTVEDKEFRRNTFDSPKARLNVQYLLNYIDRRGYLD